MHWRRGIPQMPELPTGTVTFLFTDIEGSTILWEQHPEEMRAALVRHDDLIEEVVEANSGVLVRPRGEGDSRFAVFPRASDAVAAACAIGRAFLVESWAIPEALRVRIALHTGEADLRAGDYYGSAVNRCARLRALAHGGQTLLSSVTVQLVREALPEGVGLRDLGEHRLKDLQHPERVFQLTATDLPDDFPNLRSLDALPNNLPLQLTSFIGREGEISEVKGLLATTRLLTLTGSGGCGKTRLGLQVLADLVDEFPDGVWLVELAGLADPDLVVQEAAAALGLREESDPMATGPQPSGGNGTLLTRLGEFLQAKSMLLMVDNCEHLIEACAQLVDALLHSCPNLRILAASREALAIGGETTYRVPSLSLPDPNNLPPVGEGLVSALTMYEAVGLFVDRAVAAQPNFEVTNRNAPEVAGICHRLDGIPLAIELAAARVKVLAVEEIMARLDDRFRLLTGGSRTALPRQQTLRAAIDWSYNLVSEQERILFSRLSVFLGGWTLPGAEAVCSGEGIEDFEVLDLLMSLVDKSLVVTEEEDGKTRYYLLETVRQYARDKLLDSGGSVVLRDHHLDWFLGLAEEAETELRGRDQMEWLGRLEAEHDNLRAALEWSLGSKEGEEARPELSLRLAGALGWFWFIRGYWSEGIEWLEKALAGSSSASVRAKALNRAAYLFLNQANWERAKTLAEESLTLSREAGDKENVAYSLAMLGFFAPREGKDGLAMLAESLDLIRQLGDKGAIAYSLNTMGNFALFQGDFARAGELGEESLDLFREVGDRLGIAAATAILGAMAANQGDYDRAEELLEESLSISRELGIKMGVFGSLLYLGRVALQQGDHDRALELFEQCLPLSRQLGDRRRIAGSLRLLGRAAAAGKDYGRALELYKESIVLSKEIEDPGGIAGGLEALAVGIVAAQEGQERAARLLAAAAALRQAFSVPLQPTYQEEFDRSVASVRTQLEEDAFEEAWAEGEAMTMEAAIDYALEIDEV